MTSTESLRHVVCHINKTSLIICIIICICSCVAQDDNIINWDKYTITYDYVFTIKNTGEYLRFDDANDNATLLFRYYSKESMAKLINYYKDGLSKGQRIESQETVYVSKNKAILLNITSVDSEYSTSIILIPGLEMHIGYVGAKDKLDYYLSKIKSITYSP